jgi:predicted nucleotidyltransferase
MISDKMNRGEAIDKVRAYSLLLKDHFQLENVYLYGSYANETHNDESSIDVVVVVNRVKGDYFSVSPLLWKLRRQIDRRIEPILIERDFDDADFLREVQKQGIKIA